MSCVPPAPATDGWPPAVWSCLHDRDGLTWNLADPDPDIDEGYCDCWPAQIVDYRMSMGTISLGLPEPDQVRPLHGHVIPLVDSWAEASPGLLLATALDNHGRFPRPGEPESSHLLHRKVVVETVSDLLLMLARVDGESVSEEVRGQAATLTA